MLEKTMQGYVNPFVCECGKVKSDPHAKYCRACQIAMLADLDRKAYEARQLGKARAAVWARAFMFVG